MKQRILGLTVAFAVLIILFFIGAVFYLNAQYNETTEAERAGNRAVMLNEIAMLTRMLREDPNDTESLASLEIVVMEMERYYSSPTAAEVTTRVLIIACAGCIVFAAVVFFVCYVKIIGPFGRLERFAGKVAKGNLDFPLSIQRENIFGEFSWAFDFMRSELNTARENEENAKRENKALIAAISHDIKTPVSSIRAYAEGLQNGMDTTPERRERYLGVIIKKADEVAKLTNDLFLHALSDMEKLQLEVKPYDAKTLLGEILDPFSAEYGDKVKLVSDIPDAVIMADEKRLAQVFENIIANAVKYAPGSDVEVSFQTGNDTLICEIRDFGNGIPPRDMPFAWNRFYRGENTQGVSGSGLGLYIVRYIVERCGGSVSLSNNENGLAVIFSLPLRIS